MAPGSRYHQVPRDSIDSDRDSHEYLIPSPYDGVIDASSLPKTWSVNVNASIVLRILSVIFALTGFLIMILHEPNSFIPSDVFMMLTLVLNVNMIIHSFASRFITISIVYKERDILKFGQGTFRKPNISSYLDLTFCIGLFICLTIAVAEYRDRYWYRSNPIAASVFGYLVVFTQAIIAIPTLDRLKFTVRTAIGGGGQGKQPSYNIHRPDRKISLAPDAVERNEETAIPPPMQETTETSQVATDLV